MNFYKLETVLLSCYNVCKKEHKMRGDTVVIRSYNGEPKIVRVWEISKSFILVCSDENYNALNSGGKGLMPVGIPKDDVFRYNSSHDKMLNNWKRDPELWDHLVNYA